MGFINKNLLVNGGAESGNLTGWVGDPGGWTAATNATHGDTSPLGGNEYFFPPNGTSGNIHQEIDLIARGSFSSNDLDGELLTVIVGGSLEVAGIDTGQLLIEYLDISSGVLGTYKSPLADSEIWLLHKDARILPSGTRFISYRFESIRNIGTQNNGYLDNAFVVLMSGGLGENLVINPGAEEAIDANQGPGIYGWNSNNFDVTSSITPRTGTLFFGGGEATDTEPATPKSMTQSIDITKFNEIEGGLIDGGLLKCTATAFQSSFTDGEDEGSFRVEYLDNASGVLDQFEGAFFAPRNAPWVPQLDTKQIPSGTRFIDITLTSERHAGTNNDGYFDDLSVIIESGQVIVPNEPLFVEKSVPFTTALNNTWDVIDVFSPPFNVPSGSVVEVAIGNSDTSLARLGGVRTLGSSLERTVDINSVPSNTTGWEYYSMHVQTTSGQIEVLAEVAIDIKFILLGYWKKGTYVELRSSGRNVPSVNNTWEQLDLDTLSVSGAVAEIVMCNDDQAVQRTIGVRQVGSSLGRTRQLHEAINGNTCYTVHVNTSGVNFTVDHYASDILDNSISVLGYWSELPAQSYNEIVENTIVPSGNNVWEAVGFPTVPSGTDIVIETINRNSILNNNSTLGARRIGSTHIRTYGLTEAEDGGIAALTVNVQASESGIEVFTDDISESNNSIATQGFWSGVPFETINNNATLFIHNSFVENEITLFVSAPGVPSGEIPLFITGTPSGESTLFIAGKPSGEMSLFLDATPEISGDMPLFIAGKPSGELNLYVGGKPSGEISLFTHGHVSFNAFAKVEDTLVDDDFGLFIYGGTSGQFIFDSMSFSISGGIGRSQEWNVFAKVGISTPLTSGEVTWPAFARVDNTKSSSMNLFINAGPNVDDAMSLFIRDSGTSTSLDGAIPFSGSFSVFTRVASGVLEDVSLFIEGFTFPSGATDLFMSGSPQVVSNSIGLFMSGLFEEISSSITLVIPSVLGSGNKEATLFIPGGGC